MLDKKGSPLQTELQRASLFILIYRLCTVDPFFLWTVVCRLWTKKAYSFFMGMGLLNTLAGTWWGTAIWVMPILGSSPRPEDSFILP